MGYQVDIEQALREVRELLDGCYQDGLDGAPGYPIDPDMTIQEFEEYTGEPVANKRPLERLIHLMNDTYEQGRGRMRPPL